jgi:hypothetical protein
MRTANSRCRRAARASRRTRHVRAGDEKQDADRPEEKEQGRTVVTEPSIVQRHDDRRPAAGVRRLLEVEAPVDRRKLVSRRRDRDSPLEASDDRIVANHRRAVG